MHRDLIETRQSSLPKHTEIRVATETGSHTPPGIGSTAAAGNAISQSHAGDRIAIIALAGAGSTNAGYTDEPLAIIQALTACGAVTVAVADNIDILGHSTWRAHQEETGSEQHHRQFPDQTREPGLTDLCQTVEMQEFRRIRVGQLQDHRSPDSDQLWALVRAPPPAAETRPVWSAAGSCRCADHRDHQHRH